MNLGFIGLGVMGTPMSTHLLRAGHRLALFDILPALARNLHQAFPDLVTVCATPAEVGALSEVVITMLPNGEVVRDVVLDPQGLLEGMAAGSLVLDTSSAEPWLTRETRQALLAKGIGMIDAAVSGAQWGAEAAQLVFMVGAETAELERVRPILTLMGPKIFHLGGPGSGHTMKCINNAITAMTLAATSEGLIIGKQHGLDPSAMIDVLNQSTGMSWISQTHFKQRVINRSFDDPFRLALMLKDVGIAMSLANTVALATPMMTLGHQLWQTAAEASTPEASISEFVRWVEQQAGVQIR
jgi:3-hydroxyisobutyrate dehydrogenase